MWSIVYVIFISNLKYTIKDHPHDPQRECHGSSSTLASVRELTCLDGQGKLADRTAFPQQSHQVIIEWGHIFRKRSQGNSARIRIREHSRLELNLITTLQEVDQANSSGMLPGPQEHVDHGLRTNLFGQNAYYFRHQRSTRRDPLRPEVTFSTWRRQELQIESQLPVDLQLEIEGPAR